MSKIAIITPIYPFPPDTGSRIRIYNIIKLLSGEGLQVFLFSFDHDSQLESIDALRQYLKEVRTVGASDVGYNGSLVKRLGRKVWGIPFSPRPLLQQKLSKALRDWKPDFIQLEKTISAAYLPSDQFEKTDCRIILEEGGVHHFAYERDACIQKTWFRKRLYRRQANRLKAFELDLLRRVDAVVSVSTEEVAMIRKMDRHVDILLIPNGIDPELIKAPVAPAGERKMAVFFCGNLGYAPNRDAVELYLTKIHPILQANEINIDFVVAGGGQQAFIKFDG